MSDELMEALRREIERPKADIELLRGDLNHLLQPIIGSLRMLESPGHRESHEPLFWEYLPHTIDRLRMALAVLDEAVTGEPVSDEWRGKHGMGIAHYPSLAVPEGKPEQ